MSRQLLGIKKVRKIAKDLGLPVVQIMVRGGTGHRKDLCLSDGKLIHLYLDGEMEESPYGHPFDENGNRKNTFSRSDG